MNNVCSAGNLKLEIKWKEPLDENLLKANREKKQAAEKAWKEAMDEKARIEAEKKAKEEALKDKKEVAELICLAPSCTSARVKVYNCCDCLIVILIASVIVVIFHVFLEHQI